MFFKKKPTYTENNLDGLIVACLALDPQAQRLLIKLFIGYAKSVCVHYSANKEETEEILNDSFLKVFLNLNKYDHSLPFKSWLRKIIVNTAIDYYRKNLKFDHHIPIEEVDIPDFNVDVINKIAADEIMKMVQSLAPSYRMVFSLHVIEGYSHKEIAHVLGIKEGTSKSNLRDARKKLQAMIKNNYPHLYLAYAVQTAKINEN